MANSKHAHPSDRPDKPDRPRQTERPEQRQQRNEQRSGPRNEQRQDPRHDRPYRIENSSPPRSNLLPEGSTREFYRDRGLAVAVAIKSLNDPTREQVRVVHVPSGEVVFESEAPQRRKR
jgi:hypothetical protein